MVGQSVSGLWSSLSAGIASNLLNRSLGFNSEDVARITANASRGEPQALEGAGSRTLASGDTPDAAEKRVATDARMKKLADSATGVSDIGSGLMSDHSPTLIDDELETLYSKFQQSRTQLSKDGETTTTSDEDRKARKLRNEEGKVRALNRNGRVDYSIQE
ncbi:hypothetical protein ACHAPT_010195 [Fusarium lateritium]